MSYSNKILYYDVIEDKEIDVYTKYIKYYKKSLSTYIPISSYNS